MPTAHHHHHRLPPSAVRQTIAVPPAPAAKTLPPWTHTPIFLTFAPCFVVFLVPMLRHRLALHRRGETFKGRKAKGWEYVAALFGGGALFFLRDRVPLIPLVMEWPKRHFAYYREHSFAMFVGLMAAGLAASMIAALFAAIFLRGGRGGGDSRLAPRGYAASASPFVLLPDPPLDHGWYNTTPPARSRVIRQRTYHLEGE